MKWSWDLQGQQATFKVAQDLGQRDGYDDQEWRKGQKRTRLTLTWGSR